MNTKEEIVYTLLVTIYPKMRIIFLHTRYLLPESIAFSNARIAFLPLQAPKDVYSLFKCILLVKYSIK